MFTRRVFAAWQLQLIETARRAVLGTISADGRPNLLPVCYAFVDGVFAVPVDEKPKSGRSLARVRNIERDERVSLLFDDYDDEWAQLAWLRVDGTAAVAPLGSGFPRHIEGLRERYSQYRAMALEGRPLIVITPVRSVSWRWEDRA